MKVGKYFQKNCEHMKIIYVNCGLGNKYENDLRNNEHYSSSSENSTGFEPMTSAVAVYYESTQ